jgi:hypothetical protein
VEHAPLRFKPKAKCIANHRHRLFISRFFTGVFQCRISSNVTVIVSSCTVTSIDLSTMNVIGDKARAAFYENGEIIVKMLSGAEYRFAVSENPRLSRGSPAQLNNIEISPFGLHWPDLDEDLSFRGITGGDFGQPTRSRSGTQEGID